MATIESVGSKRDFKVRVGEQPATTIIVPGLDLIGQNYSVKAPLRRAIGIGVPNAKITVTVEVEPIGSVITLQFPALPRGVYAYEVMVSEPTGKTWCVLYGQVTCFD